MKPIYKLRDWVYINIHKLNFEKLCENLNPMAINLIEQNLDKLTYDCWYKLSENPNAIHLLEQNFHKINWYGLCKNLNAIHLIKSNLNIIHKSCWYYLSENPNAISLLEKNLDKINWHGLCRNFFVCGNFYCNRWEKYTQNKKYKWRPIKNAVFLIEQNINTLPESCWYYLSENPDAISILERNTDKIDWDFLSKNFNAFDLLNKNQDKINWYGLSRNFHLCENYTCLWSQKNFNFPIYLIEKNLQKFQNYYCWYGLSENPNAIHLLEENIDKINWLSLSLNPNAIHLLEANQDKIDWNYLSKNSSIFTYDYEKMRENIKPIAEEIIKKYFSPNNIAKLQDYYGINYI